MQQQTWCLKPTLRAKCNLGNSRTNLLLAKSSSWLLVSLFRTNPSNSWLNHALINFYDASHRSFSYLEPSVTAKPPSSYHCWTPAVLHIQASSLFTTAYMNLYTQKPIIWKNSSLRRKEKTAFFKKKGIQLTNRAQLLDIKPHRYMKPQYKTHHFHDKNIIAIKVHQLLKPCTVWWSAPVRFCRDPLPLEAMVWIEPQKHRNVISVSLHTTLTKLTHTAT